MHNKLVTCETVSRLSTWDYFVNSAYYYIENKGEARVKYISELVNGIWKFYFLFGKEKEWLPDLLANGIIFINLGSFIWESAPDAKGHAFLVSYIKVKIRAFVTEETEELFEAVENVLQVGREGIGIHTIKEFLYVVASATQLALGKWDEDIKKHLVVRLRSS